jgi:hypothetical protein
LRSKRRPRLVYAIIALALIVSAIGWLRLVAGLRLPDLPLTVPRWYIPLSGGCLAVLAMIAAASLFLGARWAPAFTLSVATALSAWYWADRLLLAHSDYARVTWPAAAFVNLILLAWIFWSVRGLRQRGALSEGGR